MNAAAIGLRRCVAPGRHCCVANVDAAQLSGLFSPVRND
jgi:hypothetical protein